MGVLIIIIIAIVIIVLLVKNSSSNTPYSSNTPSSRSPLSSATVYSSNRVTLYTDTNTKKTFIMYILTSVLDMGVNHDRFSDDAGFYWAKSLIENAYTHITTGTCVTYLQAGRFNVYQGQTLTPENTVYMDLFEMLIFGDNDRSRNRANEMASEDANRIRLCLWTLNRILTNNDAETRNEKIQGAAAYDEVFS